MDLLSHGIVIGGGRLHSLISFFFFLRWHLIYSWQYTRTWCSFNTENAQFPSDLWTAPAFRILSQEKALDSLPDCAAGSAQLEPGAGGGKRSCPSTGQGSQLSVAPVPPTLRALSKQDKMQSKPLARCLFTTWRGFFSCINSATLWATCTSCWPLGTSGFHLEHEGAGQTQGRVPSEAAGETHLERFSPNRKAHPVVDIFQDFDLKNVSPYIFQTWRT